MLQNWWALAGRHRFGIFSLNASKEAFLDKARQEGKSVNLQLHCQSWEHNSVKKGAGGKERTRQNKEVSGPAMACAQNWGVIN